MSPKRVTKPLDVYVRVSDVRGRAGDSFISPKDQERRCRSLAESRGLRVGEVFTDLDVSGAKMKRPQLDRAIERIAAGTSGGIIVAKLDRFARTLVGGLQTLEQIADLGGVVIVADGEFDTSTATGELVLNMMLSLAQFELRRIRENWSSAQRHAVENGGIHISRHVPPGYRRRKDRRLEPHPKHARTLLRAYEMAAEGQPYARIAEFLTREGFPSGGKSATWRPSLIARLLANRVYLGEARYGNIVNENAHEPIVSPELFLLAQRKPRAIASTHSVYLLSGLCRCSECMYSMRPQRARDRAVGTYRCQTLNVTGHCPHPVSISMNRLDDFVLERFCEEADRRYVGSVVEDNASELVASATEAERSYRAQLTNVALRKQIGDADHDALLASLHAEWQERLSEVERSVLTHSVVSLPRDVTLTELVEQRRAEGDVEQLRRFLASEIEAVIVSPAKSRARNAPIADRVEIVWRGDRALDLPRRGRRFEPAPSRAGVA